MAPLGALSQSWVTAEASLPLGWQIRGFIGIISVLLGVVMITVVLYRP